MNIKTKLLEECVNFVKTTKKENKCFKIIILLFVIILTLLLFFALFKYLNEYYILFVRILKNR